MPANLTDAQCDEVIAAINTAKATIDRLTRERDEARRKALEEAAKVAEGYAQQARLAMQGDCMGQDFLRAKEHTAETIAGVLRLRSLSPQGE